MRQAFFLGLAGLLGDTHFVTPAIERNEKQIWDEEFLVPYRYAAQGDADDHDESCRVSSDAGKGSASRARKSAYWITTVLRKRIGYRGIVLSDDLEMGGILKFLSVDQAAVEAVRAGSDLLEICHSAELILRSYEALDLQSRAVGAAFGALLLARSREVGRKQAKLYAKGAAPALTAKQFDALRTSIQKFSERIAASAKDVMRSQPRAISPAEVS